MFLSSVSCFRQIIEQRRGHGNSVFTASGQESGRGALAFAVGAALYPWDLNGLQVGIDDTQLVNREHGGGNPHTWW